MVDIEFINMFSGSIQNIATVAALIIGSYWTYSRYIRHGEGLPRVDLSVEIRCIGFHGDNIIIELLSYVENKGFARQVINVFDYSLYGLNAEDKLKQKDNETNIDMIFPHKLLEGSWITKDIDFYFVDPGTKTEYSNVTYVNKNVAYLCLVGKFSKKGSSVFYTSKKIIKVPDLLTH